MSEAMRTDQLFAFVVYLVACAHVTLEEPPIYGSFRLIEGAGKLIASFDDIGDEFLATARAEIEREKLRIIDDLPGYEQWVGDLIRRFAAEATRRNLVAEPPSSA